jgi:hypothetical protein
MKISNQPRWPNSDSRQGDFFLDEESPCNRCGLSEPQESSLLSTRLLHGIFFVSAWLAMPFAVLTCHGWVGLLVHGLALSGAAGLLQRATIQTRKQFQRVAGPEGDGVCASVIERI